jgi:hypothetical protein
VARKWGRRDSGFRSLERGTDVPGESGAQARLPPGEGGTLVADRARRALTLAASLAGSLAGTLVAAAIVIHGAKRW